MKKTQALIIALILCVILFASYFIISSLPEKQSSDKEDDAYILVDRNEPSEITEFSFVGGEFALCFEKNGEGDWKYTENKTLPVNAEFIETLLEGTELILASKLINDNIGENDLDQYGLSEPSCTLTLTTKNSSATYFFGDTIKSKGLCYLTKKGSNAVYLVETSYIDNFSVDVGDCLSLDAFPEIKPDEILSVSITCGDFQQTIGSGEDEKLFSALSALRCERSVDFGKEKFDIYGLSDSEAIDVTVSLGAQKNVALRFGLGETEEFIYLLVQNSDNVFSEMIYLFSCSEFETLYEYLSSALESRTK